ncbi:hypothetical protein IMCC9480_2479 [Oxalobacteraceae bacterium IMCC9480]|nr:hypothetical protein IMCC9480_2479 [Oxalobacteraceae bacterium IMCC9480]
MVTSSLQDSINYVEFTSVNREDLRDGGGGRKDEAVVAD